NPPKNVLVIGSSTGYGLSSRIVPAFAGGASTVGVFFEKPPTERKTASAGWYNTAAFEEEAEKAGIYAKSFNGDAFSNEIKDQVIATIKADLGKIDTVVYSLASPRRMDPTDGETYKSVLKPIGEPYTQKNLNTESGVVDEITIEPCTEEEIAHTVKVMGGEDWELWMNALAEADVLADGVKTVAYSYIGPELTFPIYTNGTIGKAKEHVEESAARLNEKFGDGTAVVSVNKALVTQASSAIPVVPLYISLLYKVMKEAGNHEGCIEQIQRLFSDHLASANGPTIDEKGRIRIDDWEMSEAVQKLVHEKWAEVNTENLSQISDFSGYRDEFLKLFGFGAQGVDYSAEVNQEKPIISVS
ncbi:trans-2-enoyl-CoA reductase family protein, partial [Verrucomicrobiales bacterium]|nr:trans-2-enoyl-CoA reductase family protein [Verrucomicrobiales bacterium]